MGGAAGAPYGRADWARLALNDGLVLCGVATAAVLHGALSWTAVRSSMILPTDPCNYREHDVGSLGPEHHTSMRRDHVRPITQSPRGHPTTHSDTRSLDKTVPMQ